jgi:hypothetical protein
MNLLVTGYIESGVRNVTESLNQEKKEDEWHVEYLELVEDDNLSIKFDLGDFIPELIIIVSDSTQKNVEKTSNLVHILKRQFPYAYKIAIANYQDLPERLTPESVEELLGLTTYGR